MSFFARIQRALGIRSLGYEGAGGGRRFRNSGVNPSALSAQLSAFKTLQRRARWLSDNTGPGRAAVEAWESALAGSGIHAQSRHPDPEMRHALNAAFLRWTRESDFDGLNDFFGQQALVARRLVIDGEVFAANSYDDHGRLRVRLFESEQCDGNYNYELPGGRRIIAGVEYAADQRRIAYHFQRSRPGMPIDQPFDLIRLGADDVQHIFRVETPGQVRGVSWFTPVILKIMDLDKSTDAQLMRQQVAAMFAAFIVDPNGSGVDFTSDQRDGLFESGLEPGMMKLLGPGQDIKFSQPAEVGQESIEFMKFIAREIAAGLGLPYEMVMPDLSSVNYSSIRAGLVEFRRRAEKIQWQVLIRSFCEPTWRRFITAEILSGRIDAPDFESNPDKYLDVDFLPPKTQWVDPLKDCQAEVLAIANGLMSRREAVAARGRDIDELDREIAEDRASAERLNLSFGAPQETTQEQNDETNADA